MPRPEKPKRTSVLRIAEVARRQGVTTITELQMRTGISYSTLHALWTDDEDADPRLTTLEAIAKALGVSTKDLYEPSSIADTPLTEAQ
jgi:DNA-binding Xre family transcriptional regulator